jgi:carboxypeptidase C (cathepsin A)
VALLYGRAGRLTALFGVSGPGQWEGLSFVTVHGAGHMVPATRPAQGLLLLKNFLADVW